MEQLVINLITGYIYASIMNLFSLSAFIILLLSILIEFNFPFCFFSFWGKCEQSWMKLDEHQLVEQGIFCFILKHTDFYFPM